MVDRSVLGLSVCTGSFVILMYFAVLRGILVVDRSVRGLLVYIGGFVILCSLQFYAGYWNQTGEV